VYVLSREGLPFQEKVNQKSLCSVDRHKQPKNFLGDQQGRGGVRCGGPWGSVEEKCGDSGDVFTTEHDDVTHGCGGGERGMRYEKRSG